MKKARLMLSALAICAVLASAFAFTAEKFNVHFIYTGAKDGGACTIKTNGAAISNGTANIAASTTSLASGCPNVFTVEIAD
jgi:hypothetical protein